VVKGKPRRIPVQPGSSTPKGESYDLGFDKLRQFDPAAAVELFKQAEIENPDNPLVRNAMDLARDLVKVRQDAARDQAEREKFSSARTLFLAGVYAMRSGDMTGADDLLSLAINKNPADADLVAVTDSMRLYLYWAKKAQPDIASRPEDKGIYAAIVKRSSAAMIAMLANDYSGAVNQLETAEFLLDGYNDYSSFFTVENYIMVREGLRAAAKEAKRLLVERNK
jgi:tetratricopeptide (TPR) repeat protein